MIDPLTASWQETPEQLLLLYETSRRISTAIDIDGVIQAYLEQVGASGRYVCSVALYERDESGRRTAIVVRGRWSPESGTTSVGERHPYVADALDQLLDSGHTVTIADVETDTRVPPNLRRIQVHEGRPALAMAPLMVRGERIGLVLLSYATPHEWQDVELQPYEVTAAQLASAIDSRQQIQRLHERSRQVAILEERQRLARDLHDSVTQLLFSITLIAQSIAPAWQREPAEGQQRVERVLELSQAAHREMRRLLAELRPSAEPTTGPSAPAVSLRERLRHEGLAALLRQHVASLHQDRLKISLRISAYSPQHDELEEALFCIAQEATHNAMKYAEAASLRVRLRLKDGVVELQVKDDGIGISQAKGLRPAAGFQLGFATMRERVDTVGGVLRVVTAPGKGTAVEARVPAKGPPAP